MLFISDVPINLLGKHTASPPRILALPGSFNPLHAGHASALQACADRSGSVPLFELSVFNVDKPPVPLHDLVQRLSHFAQQDVCILLTKTPRFIDKARAYPGLSYVIGVDTLVRASLFHHKLFFSTFLMARKGTARRPAVYRRKHRLDDALPVCHHQRRQPVLRVTANVWSSEDSRQIWDAYE
jgi:hypothetical protein